MEKIFKKTEVMMERKHENYHIRPFPQQPKRGGKLLVATLDELEDAFSVKRPDLEQLGLSQAKLHEALTTANDDALVDMVRQLSHFLDEYRQNPRPAFAQKVVEQLLKVRLQLKRLH
jgi:hypothetical protein